MSSLFLLKFSFRMSEIKAEKTKVIPVVITLCTEIGIAISANKLKYTECMVCTIADFFTFFTSAYSTPSVKAPNI